MPSTKDIDIFSALKILLIGDNGGGKTVAAAGFHKAGPMRVDDCDGRMKPVKEYYPDADIFYQSYSSHNLDKFVDFMDSVQEEKIPPNGPTAYKTWLLDSVTSFSSTSVTYQLRVRDKIKTTKGGMPATSWDEMNGETVMFHQALEVAKILNKEKKVHIIWTAHPVPKTQIVEGEDSKKTMSLACFGIKAPAIIPGFFDEIYNFELERVGTTGKYRRWVYTVPNNLMPGKTVYRKLLPRRFDITDKNFYEVLMGYLTGKIEKKEEEENG